ncbi:transposase [Streptomyces sp. NPDC050287]|uniref:transposase n=1 Tax=Streptomyces sp. NPDC050287 TaxID=3365608 RepID=UPI00379E23D9
MKPFEIKRGYRYQAIATNTVGRQLQWLDARHRVHAHVESGIRRSKALTLTRLPSFKFAFNQTWCTLLALAMDLHAWLRLLALDGKHARAEPTTIRDELLDVPAKLTEHARRRELKLDSDWPASHRVVTAWDRVRGCRCRATSIGLFFPVTFTTRCATTAGAQPGSRPLLGWPRPLRGAGRGSSGRRAACGC